MLNHLFIIKSGNRPPKDVVPTVVLTKITDDKGNTAIVAKDLMTVVQPLVGLSYTDMSISTLIENGVSPKHIAISSDLRLGFDSEIEKFNNYVKDNFEKIFETPKK